MRLSALEGFTFPNVIYGTCHEVLMAKASYGNGDWHGYMRNMSAGRIRYGNSTIAMFFVMPFIIFTVHNMDCCHH